MKKLKIVIFGLGSIGQRHGRILQTHFKHDLYAFRSGHGKTSGNPLGIAEIRTWKEVAALKPQAAFITNPTFQHVPTALKCLKRRINVFIEKPLSDSLKGVKELTTLCHQKKLTAYVAYCLRFHPVIMKIKSLVKGRKILHARVVCSSMLSEWRPKSNGGKNYSRFRSMGGGAILDLSHEFDYIRFLFGEIRQIKGLKGRMGEVTVDTEDFADALVTLESGVVVNCHINFASCNRERTIHVDFKEGFISADLIRNTLVYQKNGKVLTFQYANNRNDYLLSQTKYFLKNLNNPGLMNGIKDAAVLLEKILEFRNGR